MPRFYNVTMTPASPYAKQGWSSVVNGSYDAGALDVEFDFLTTVGANPTGYSSLSIKGVGIKEIVNAPNYGFDPTRPQNAHAIVIEGGMTAPSIAGWPQPRPGVLLKGVVYQCFGNWVGTDISLDFVISPGPAVFTTTRPANFVFTWKPGQPLLNALEMCLLVAYGSTVPITANIRSYAPPHNWQATHTCATFDQLAAVVKSATAAQSPSGAGVDLALTAGGILVFDGSVGPTGSNTVQLQFTDLIGQPTWIAPNLITFTSVMRGDVRVGTYVVMPPALQNVPGFSTQTAAALPSTLRQTINWATQRFFVNAVRHVGSFRDPQGSSWASIFQAVPWSGTSNG